jgi:hypothetical protein
MQPGRCGAEPLRVCRSIMAAGAPGAQIERLGRVSGPAAYGCALCTPSRAHSPHKSLTTFKTDER